MFKKILVILVVILVIFIGIVAIQPPQFHIVRSATIAAPAAVVYAQVNDFHNWPAWSPWAKLDPNMKVAYAGPASGTGAIYTWTGNKEVGEGRMTILESHPSDLVKIKLEFLKPFASTNTTEFDFKPQGNQTVVTWSMTGEKNFMAKAFHMFVNMDKMIGGDFEKGLAQMKTVSEAANQQEAASEAVKK